MYSLKKMVGNKNYIFLFCANLTSQMGSIIGLTAFMYYILDRFSTQPMYATITELIYSLPVLFVFFLVGVLADNMDRKKIAVYSEWICGILSMLLLYFSTKEWIILIFAILFLRSLVVKFFQPAQQGIIQGVLTKDEYAVAASLNQLVSSLFLLFGSGLGLLVYWKVGLQGAVLIDTVSFIVSGILIQRCSLKEEICLPNGPHQLKDMNIKSIIRSYVEGLQYIFNNKLLLSLISGFCVFGIINGGLSIIPVFMMKYKLVPENYESAMIWVGIVFGSGMLIGSIVSSIIVNKFKLYQIIITGLIFTGIFIGMSGLTDSIYTFLILSFLAALFLPLINVGISGWLPRIVEYKMMGRVQGCITPLIMMFQSLTLSIIAVVYPDKMKIEWLFFLVGLLLVIVAIIYFVLLPRLVEKNQKIVDASLEM
ncbi:MFS transporter [Bacillus cereus]|uniref:MFS transporter n=1 Tax=Bacillus cereus TaxID=1396 RepID=A0ABD7R7Z4_BACCE|nr:MFS transporter [Bacillus cereus]AOM03746.1 ABC transporter, permease protein, putative [Bacillus cereus]MCC2369993.1 MFS transporter [Bacillus cereus]MCC2452110.1 MFS transporter [Bacillus cereus]MCC2491516.1 MFS transporter [Bacillus cereus]MCU5452025.1 MFS transporter [Bacillus cereus]